MRLHLRRPALLAALDFRALQQVDTACLFVFNAGAISGFFKLMRAWSIFSTGVRVMVTDTSASISSKIGRQALSNFFFTNAGNRA